MKNTLTQQPNTANKCCRSFKNRFWGFLVLTWLVAHVSVLNTKAQTLKPTEVWSKIFGTSDSEPLKKVIQTTDGGFLAAGTSNGGIERDRTEANRGTAGGATAGDFWIVKTDAAGTKLWDKRFGASLNETLTDIQKTSDGGYILGGTSNSTAIEGDKSEAGRGNTDYWVVKIDANGNKLWDKRFGTTVADNLVSLQQTSDGGYILGGTSGGIAEGDKSQASHGLSNDYWVVKIDATGTKQWDKRFGASSTEILSTIIQTADGGYMLGGTLNSAGTGGDLTETGRGFNDYWIVKTDANGNKLWDKLYGSSLNDYFTDLKQTTDGGYVLLGYSNGSISGEKTQDEWGGSQLYDYWMVKVDATGTKQWDKTYGSGGHDYPRSVRQMPDGGYLLAGGNGYSTVFGDRTETSFGLTDIWVVRTNSSGDRIWDDLIGTASDEPGFYAEPTADGGIIVGGYSPFNADFRIIKLSAEEVLDCNDLILFSQGTTADIAYFESTNASIGRLEPNPGPAQTSNTKGLVTDGEKNLYKVDYDVAVLHPLQKYSNGTWTTLAICPLLNVTALAYDGTFIYALSSAAAGYSLAKYNISTNTWATLGTAYTGGVAGLGFTYARMVTDGTTLFITNNTDTWFTYNLNTNSWGNITTLAGMNEFVFEYCNGKLYSSLTASPYTFYEYTIATNTWVSKPINAGTAAVAVRLATVGDFVYAVNTATKNLYQYNTLTSTWSGLLGTFPTLGGTPELRSLCSNLCNATATTAITQVTCGSGSANTDGKITLSAVNGATKVAYNVGSTYTNTATFTTGATTIGALPYDVVATLPNPSVPQPYTVRVFKADNCFKDYVLTLQPKQCRTADLSVTVTPLTATKNQAETATFLVTVANAGPDAANNVKVKVNIPLNGTLQAAVATQGNYTDSTKMWDVGTIANGASKTLTISIKVN